ncbi:MAG: hypothetical protein K2F63_06940 [Muribaculaceae bacterium]|nr:hypothetical protein [Muribaculaceae bacterium]
MGILIHDKGFEFLRPYFREALPPGEAVYSLGDDSPDVSLAVMISTTDVYSGACDFVSESASVEDSAGFVRAEREFKEMCAAAGLRGVVLRCAPVIGTGMNGFPRSLANDIWRGVFFHFPGNETRLSVVHAADVASVVATMNREGCPEGCGLFNLTDGEHPTLSDLAEALAFRMGEKRISTLSTRPQQMIARWIYGKRYKTWTTNRTFDSSALNRALGFKPRSVCAYLRNHVYDDSSL